MIVIIIVIIMCYKVGKPKACKAIGHTRSVSVASTVGPTKAYMCTTI
jgi:hypothetical protein